MKLTGIDAFVVWVVLMLLTVYSLIRFLNLAYIAYLHQQISEIGLCIAGIALCSYVFFRLLQSVKFK